MTRKELKDVVVQIVDRVVTINNGYFQEDYFVLDNGHELSFCKESDVDDNETVIYRIDSEGINSIIDPVIEEIEELSSDDPKLKTIIVDIADCYLDCDDNFYQLVGYEDEEAMLKVLLSEF